MRTFVHLAVLAALTGCPGSTDVTGCPFDRSAAIGTACPDEGQQCGEISLCEECTADPSVCEPIECVDGVWASVPIDEFCDG